MVGLPLPKVLVVGLISLYKNVLSPHLHNLLGGACRYQPTCSVYAKQAIEKFGIFTGLQLSIGRFLRCHPFSKVLSYNPVPERLS